MVSKMGLFSRDNVSCIAKSNAADAPLEPHPDEKVRASVYLGLEQAGHNEPDSQFRERSVQDVVHQTGVFSRVNDLSTPKAPHRRLQQVLVQSQKDAFKGSPSLANLHLQQQIVKQTSDPMIPLAAATAPVALAASLDQPLFTNRFRGQGSLKEQRVSLGQHQMTGLYIQPPTASPTLSSQLGVMSGDMLALNHTSTSNQLVPKIVFPEPLYFDHKHFDTKIMPLLREDILANVALLPVLKTTSLSTQTAALNNIVGMIVQIVKSYIVINRYEQVKPRVFSLAEQVGIYFQNVIGINSDLLLWSVENSDLRGDTLTYCPITKTVIDPIRTLVTLIQEGKKFSIDDIPQKVLRRFHRLESNPNFIAFFTAQKFKVARVSTTTVLESYDLNGDGSQRSSSRTKRYPSFYINPNDVERELNAARDRARKKGCLCCCS